MKRIFVSLAALTLFTATALPASAGVLFSQGTDPTLTGRWQSETSNGSNGFNQAFDNFSLASDGTINNVSWTGFTNPDFTPINGFTISIYADNFDNSDSPGAVGTLLASTIISGDAGQTPNATPNVGNFGVFNFSTAITPFQATAGTTYWISIVGDPAKNSGDVFWSFAAPGAGDGSFNTYDGNFVTAVGTDMAFTLSNSVVPEPSGLMLDGSGLLVLAGFGRRLLAQKLRK
jgi:hypothetical protein